ncbi:TlpA disulfide reductase family protein [Polaribacter undariae]|uniref:TlpA disulfide reductase family protein n=1 Tax=Polaribacter sejongensis TaxID=985043 RepID=A0AAJ1QY77_9FLAO|nr:TlpA disulfide reductase family protein [Polaribacter undariae]MDN3619997.1 TlpA disulfide reductase family protein [Polaribacter undariae]UWD31757.1 TlpA family protein disulfide reductase [Polaribacter undariae]
MKKIVITFFLLLLTTNLVSQWKYPEAENIKNDVVITYDVVYERELSDKLKKHPYYKKEIIVAFNKGKILEKSISNRFDYQMSTLLDYDKEKGYSCVVTSTKNAIVSSFGKPKKEVQLKVGETKEILGFPCQVYTTKIKGKTVEILTTKKIGLRFVKNFNVQGFLLKYTSINKYLGPFTVTAKNIIYTKLPSDTYSLKGFTIKTLTEQKEYLESRKVRSNEVKQSAIDKLGELSPKYSVRSIQGNKFKSKDLIGKVVVLNFWFTTCPPCKKELPHLNKLKEKFKGKDVVFIAIALDDEYKIDTFLKRNPFYYDIVEDGRWIAEKFDVKSYPSNIIIDQKGSFQFYKIGYKSDVTASMEYQINKLLKK